MIYQIFFYMMLVGFVGCGVLSPTLKLKVIGVLLAIVNFLILYRSKV